MIWHCIMSIVVHHSIHCPLTQSIFFLRGPVPARLCPHEKFCFSTTLDHDSLGR